MELLISGPDGDPTRVELVKPALTLGRAVDNDLAYPDDPWLSRSHLRFELHEKYWWIKDCASRNGTVLNAASVKEASRIKAGDRIYAGHLTIDVRESEHTALRPVISFITGEGEKVTREATLETCLDEVLGKDSYERRPSKEPSLESSRVIGALIRAGQQLVKNQTLEELFEVILELSLSAVEAKRGVILTLEEGELVVKASKGDGFMISTAVRDRVIRQKNSLMISDAQSDDALRQQQSIVMHQVRSMMAAPLQTSDVVIGLIYVDNGAVIRPFTREDLDLLTVMANVAAIRIENARLAEIEHSEKLTELELSQASEIQKMLLPTDPPVYQGYDLAGLNLACRTVGGDYYDFLPYQDGRLALMVGDVSGKGLPAALLMSSLQARVQMFRETSPEPGFAVTTLNRSLTERCPLGKFITFFYGLLDGATGAVRYSNAGHNYPLVMRKDGSVERLKGNGLVMGLFSTVHYEVRETKLQPGELLVLYSDGVTEASTSNGKEFGEDGLATFLATRKSVPCEEIVNQLVDHMRKWRGNTAFADDFTIVLVRRL
ncbi:MAG TPA: SpoIIE family protein phosphatase [Bryobacteraceae bacterium]|nr:SpoIIE family protein phosphatase [Bryobacteraceae bacterium]